MNGKLNSPAVSKTALLIVVVQLVLALPLMASMQAGAQNIPDLTTAELKKKMDAGEQLLLVDSRTSEEYRLAHLPGAINIPPSRFGAIAGLLPPDKDMPLIFYCRGYS